MKQKIKLILDVLMTALLVVLMAYPVTGQAVHEWTGAGMFLLFLAHHLLNFHWLKALGKGKYSGPRILRTDVDVLLLADMLALMFSGVRLSRYVFAFLPGLGSAATAQRLHMLASYWGLVLMGVHLGLHGGVVTAPLRRRSGGKAGPLPWCAGTAVGLYGAYAAWRHQIWQYLTLRSEFISFDFDRSAALYFLDHFCMMALFALLACAALSLVRKHRKRSCEAVKRLITAVLAVLLLSCAACGSQESTAPPTGASAGLFAMDTYLHLTAYGEKAEAALEQAQNRIRELESLWSATDEHSEIYAANHSGGTAAAVSGDTADLVRYALDMARQTDGALEPTLYPVLTAWGFTTDSFQIPAEEQLGRLLEKVDYTKISLEDAALTVPDGMQLDLGAVGKGYAADETAAVLRENGVESALLDFGGNILAIGAKPDGSPWRVGVLDPDSEGNLGVLELVNQGVSVSGGYEKYFIGEDGERYWHILDPATGAPARSGLVQTAVVSGESKRCDALSTALFVIGLDRAVQHWREHRDFEMILLAEDRTVYVTEGLSGAFSLGTGQEGREAQVIRYEA